MTASHAALANGFRLPAAHLNEIYDSLVLALDATERRTGRYTQEQREARSYIRNALRKTKTLMEA